jgi:hypothetical protein
MLTRLLLGGEESDPMAAFDHPKGKPLPNQCALEKVAWKETPSLYGLEGFTQVKGQTDALALGKRSYAHLKEQLLDLDKKRKSKRGSGQRAHPGAELAAISVMHYAPGDDGALLGWGEVYLLVVDGECVVSPLLMLRTGSKPVSRTP